VPRARSGSRPHADPEGVLARAVMRAGGELGVSQSRLARVIGVSEATISRVSSGRGIDPGAKEGELAVLFVRLFRSLDTLCGGDAPKARAWFHAPNRHLGGVPAERVQTIAGLVDVVSYLDAFRGKL